jgi:hypothetical protein
MDRQVHTYPTAERLAEGAMKLTTEEQAMVNAINQYRRIRGGAPLQVDDVLMTAARARVSVFNHNHPQHGWMHEHGRRLGYVATDNIAQDYPTGVDAIGDSTSGWGDERPGHTVGHDMQMKGFTKINGQWVNQHFDRVGVAVSGGNYIAVFGRRL